jgi:hypothetical protein
MIYNPIAFLYDTTSKLLAQQHENDSGWFHQDQGEDLFVPIRWIFRRFVIHFAGDLRGILFVHDGSCCAASSRWSHRVGYTVNEATKSVPRRGSRPQQSRSRITSGSSKLNGFILLEHFRTDHRSTSNMECTTYNVVLQYYGIQGCDTK